MFGSILTFFLGPNGLFLGLGSGSKTILGSPNIDYWLLFSEFCSIMKFRVCVMVYGVPSDYWVSIKLQLWLFCCWAVTILFWWIIWNASIYYARLRYYCGGLWPNDHQSEFYWRLELLLGCANAIFPSQMIHWEVMTLEILFQSLLLIL